MPFYESYSGVGQVTGENPIQEAGNMHHKQVCQCQKEEQYRHPEYRMPAEPAEGVGQLAGRYLLLGGGLKHAPVIDDTKPGKYSAFDLSRYSGSGNGMELTWQTIPPAWDEHGFYIVHGLFNYVWDKRTSPENRPYLIPAAYGMDNIEDYLDRGAPEKEWPGESWSAGELDGSETVSLALAANAVVAVCQTPFKDQRNPQWSVNCLDRKSGKLLWSHRLSSPALPGGLLIDRDGRVAVTLRDGGVVCFGGV